MSGAIAQRANETTKALGGKARTSGRRSRLLALAERGDPRSPSTARSRRADARRRRRERPLLRRRHEDLPGRRARRRPPRRAHDRRPDEARPADDVAEDLLGQAPAPSEGRAAARRGRHRRFRRRRCRSSSTASSRARRRSASSSSRARCACAFPPRDESVRRSRSSDVIDTSLQERASGRGDDGDRRHTPRSISQRRSTSAGRPPARAAASTRAVRACRSSACAAPSCYSRRERDHLRERGTHRCPQHTARAPRL